MAFFTFQEPGIKELKETSGYPKEPQIITMPPQKMMVVEVKGDPNNSGGTAFRQLYNAYYKIRKNNKDLDIVTPRVRWLQSFNTPKKEWTGIYGIPLPSSVDKLPDGLGNIKLDTWQYGEVAEVLYVGSYSDEKPAIDKLINFINSQGYEIAGAHEEEYIKGPGMFFKGAPENYYTLIRYPVRPAHNRR